MSAGNEVRHELAPERHVWLQVIKGSLAVGNGDSLEATLGKGDGLAVSGERSLTIRAAKDSEFLLFDLA